MLISQTTKNVESFLEIANYLIRNCAECRVFNTICNATFDNQDSARNLAKEVDVMVIVGGKNSSNTKQLYNIFLVNHQTLYVISLVAHNLNEYHGSIKGETVYAPEIRHDLPVIYIGE